MNTKAFCVVALLAAASLSALQGCGDDGGPAQETAGAGAGGGSSGAGASSGAGGNGAGGLAGLCAQYCATYIENCATFATNSYEDEDDCNQTCMTAGWGTVGASGNTIYCRIYHAGSAADSPDLAELHCGHASLESTDFCK